SPRLLMPKIRPAATEGALSPPPSPLIFQASGGPSLGHSLSRPCSLEMAFRSGPCHCGQSSAETEDTRIDQPSMPMSVRVCRIDSLFFICFIRLPVHLQPEKTAGSITGHYGLVEVRCGATLGAMVMVWPEPGAVGAD